MLDLLANDGPILHLVGQIGVEAHRIAYGDNTRKLVKVLSGLHRLGFRLIASTPNWRRYDPKVGAHTTYELLFRKVKPNCMLGIDAKLP